MLRLAPQRAFRVSALLVVALLIAGAATPRAVAQDQGAPPVGTVRGTVVDAASGETIPAASAALWADSSLVTGAVSDQDGAFEIENVRPGRYQLRVSYVGYQTKTVPDVAVGRDSPNVDLGSIALQESDTQLDEVEVTAEREYMEVGVDRTVYNTGAQPITAGGSARNVLETLPSVEVDIEGNISLRGSQNVAIYLNGKPAPMSGESLTSFLESLAAEDVERVEVIPNPSASYEPEGTGGIINIVLGKNEDRGWGGGVSASAGTRERYNGSANAHYGSGPWTLFANYGLRYGEREGSGFRYRENRSLDPTTYLEEDMESARLGWSNSLNASVDYALSEKNTLSFSSVLSHRTSDDNEENTYLELDAPGDPSHRYERVSEGEGTDFSMDHRLAFRRVVTPREHELTVEASFEQDRQDEAETYTQRNLPLTGEEGEATLVERQVVDEEENEREAELEANYQRPLGERANLEAGYDGSFEWQNNRFYSESTDGSGPLTPDENQNNTFDYAEQTHALFGTLDGTLGDFGAQVGLRLEQALTTFDLTTVDETFDNEYFSFFPSVHLSYEPGERNTIKASYSKRVRRPNTWQLNPYGDFDDPTFRRVGNPYLDPEYTHSFEVGYTRMGDAYTLTLSPYYRLTTNAISWREELLEGGVTRLTFENFSTERSYGAELIGSLTVGEWLKSNGSVNAYKQVTDGSNLTSELSADALGFRTRLSATVSLPEGVDLQFSQFYRSPMDVPGGRIDAFTSTDMALRKQFLDDRFSINLRASDVFNTMGFSLQRDMEDYYQTYRRDPNTQGLQLSLRYTFGRKGERRREGAGGEGGPPAGEGMEGGGYGGQ